MQAERPRSHESLRRRCPNSEPRAGRRDVIAVAIVFGVAVLIGFRTSTNSLRWLGALGVVVAVSLAFSWLGAAIGVYAKGVESASNIPTPVMLLPLLGSGLVPTESMPGWLQAFAGYQPFTPFGETLRSLLLGTPIESNGLLALVWCAVIGVGGWMLASSCTSGGRYCPVASPS